LALRSRQRNIRGYGFFIARAKLARYMPTTLIASSFLLFVLTSWNIENLNSLRGGLSNVFMPALNIVTAPIQSAANKVSEISGLAHLGAENAALKLENQRLTAWYQVAQQLKSDNESLRQLMSAELPERYDFITARTITDNKRTYVRSLLISAGADEGAEKGQAVIGRHGVIGRVIETADHASRVLLLNDVNARLPVIVGAQQTPSIVAGDNGSVLKLIHTPRELEINSGDVVLTSGHGGLIPAGLPVGQIQINAEGTPYIDVSYGFENIEYVRIVNKYTDPALKASLDKLNQ
jgi:rod shape-determining protein MreC